MAVSPAQAAKRWWQNGGLLQALTSVILALGATYVFVESRLDALYAQVHGASERISVIESNRFTNADSLHLWRKLAEVETAMAAIPSEVPPNWFLQQVRDMQVEQHRMVERLLKLEKDLNRLEARGTKNGT